MTYIQLTTAVWEHRRGKCLRVIEVCHHTLVEGEKYAMSDLTIDDFPRDGLVSIAQWRTDPEVNQFFRPGIRTVEEVRAWYDPYFSRVENRLRSPRRPLVGAPHDVGILQRPFSQGRQGFCEYRKYKATFHASPPSGASQRSASDHPSPGTTPSLAGAPAAGREAVSNDGTARTVA